MKIRIDPHLTRFEVIRQLRDLIISYNKAKTSGEYEDEKYSFNDYLYQRSLDPVKKFLLLCIPEESLSGDVDYDQMITYWTNKFQTFRGTLKIFDILSEMGGILGIILGKGSPGDSDYVPSYYYDTKTLEVNFTETETTDINLLVRTGTEFFKALLYYQELRDTYETIKLNLVSDIYINLSAGAQFYSTYTAIEEDEI